MFIFGSLLFGLLGGPNPSPSVTGLHTLEPHVIQACLRCTDQPGRFAATATRHTTFVVVYHVLSDGVAFFAAKVVDLTHERGRLRRSRSL